MKAHASPSERFERVSNGTHERRQRGRVGGGSAGGGRAGGRTQRKVWVSLGRRAWARRGTFLCLITPLCSSLCGGLYVGVV